MRKLTERQEKLWREKMRQLEVRIIRYYAFEGEFSNPDGSFCMSAFKAVWYLRRKTERRLS